MRLIVGGDSKIGLSLQTAWKKQGIEFAATTRRTESNGGASLILDLENSLDDFQLIKCNAVILCAGITANSECENNNSFSRYINVTQTLDLARRFADKGCYVLLLSTSQVFDGVTPFPKSTDGVCPVTEYGKQKSEAEAGVLEFATGAVLRLTKVESELNPLVADWKVKAKSNKKFEAFSDVYIAPVNMCDVIQMITALTSREATGIHHLGGDEELSYYEYARNLLAQWNCEDQLVVPVKVPAERQSVLIHSSLG